LAAALFPQDLHVTGTMHPSLDAGPPSASWPAANDEKGVNNQLERNVVVHVLEAACGLL
jgi:hypothetical protein